MASVEQIMLYIMIPIDKVQLCSDFHAFAQLAMPFLAATSSPTKGSFNGIVEITVGLASSSQ